MTDKYTDLLSRMIEIPSPSGEEGKVADMLEAFLRDSSLPVRRKGNNLWLDSDDVRPSGGKGTILLNAHIDTVRPAEGWKRNPYEAQIEDGKLYGLGSNDDGASVVALLRAWEILCSKPQPCRLVWSATAEEENGGPEGLEMILPKIGKPDLGIFGEPTGMRMAIAERGLLVLDCISHGKPGHAAGNDGVNAIYSAMKDIEWFRTYHFPQVSSLLGEVGMNVTVIQAGTQHNVIPGECRFTVDIRPNELYSNEDILQTVRRNTGCDVSARSMKHGSSSVSPGHPVVLRGISLGLETFGSNTLSNQTLADFPSVKIGPGESGRSHAADEFIRLQEIEGAVDIYVKLLDSLTI